MPRAVGVLHDHFPLVHPAERFPGARKEDRAAIVERLRTGNALAGFELDDSLRFAAIGGHASDAGRWPNMIPSRPQEKPEYGAVNLHSVTGVPPPTAIFFTVSSARDA